MTAEDSTENMPDEILLCKRKDQVLEQATAIDITSGVSEGVALAASGLEIKPYYSQAELDRRVAEAEERQRIETFEKTIDVLRDFKVFRRWHDEISYEDVEYILGAILNAGGKDDE